MPVKRSGRSQVEIELQDLAADREPPVDSAKASIRARDGREVQATRAGKVLRDFTGADRIIPRQKLYKRAVRHIRVQYLKVKIVVVNRVITWFTRLDDQLVKLFHSKKGETAFWQKLFRGNHMAGLAEARESFLGPLISENTEELMGVVFPEGIPPDQKQFYTKPRLLVIKDGATNRFGHALLAFGDASTGSARYVQISSANWYPEHMDSLQFADYMEKWGNNVAFEIDLKCQDEESMWLKLNELSQKKWLWGGPWHNCLSFVVEVAKAGGSEEGVFRDYATVSNRIPDGLQKGILLGANLALNRAGVQSWLWEDGLKELQEKLAKILEHEADSGIAVDEVDVDEFIACQLARLERAVDEATLPVRMKQQLKKAMNVQCRKHALRELERLNQEYMENQHRNLADLPLAGAYNMPVGNRRVGPQTLAGFNDEDGL